ncbi:MAG: SDR family NAD(P)-dependent oxidoreductase, partial [Lewinella sp.]
MKTNLADKIVVISGAAGKRGSIGQVMLQRLAEEGAIPAVLDRNDRGQIYVEELQQRGTDALFVQTDVTRPEQIEA